MLLPTDMNDLVPFPVYIVPFEVSIQPSGVGGETGLLNEGFTVLSRASSREGRSSL